MFKVIMMLDEPQAITIKSFGFFEMDARDYFNYGADWFHGRILLVRERLHPTDKNQVCWDTIEEFIWEEKD